jgi:hypothetical protein
MEKLNLAKINQNTYINKAFETYSCDLDFIYICALMQNKPREGQVHLNGRSQDTVSMLGTWMFDRTQRDGRDGQNLLPLQ